MSVLVDNPTDMTIGAAWCAIIGHEWGPAIYGNLDEIARQVETIGVKLSEGQPARRNNCYLSIGKKRENGRRTLELCLQAPLAEPETWANYGVIAMELHDSSYRFRYYTSHKPQIKNDFSSRSFTEIYKIPQEVFESLKEQING